MLGALCRQDGQVLEGVRLSSGSNQGLADGGLLLYLYLSQALLADCLGLLLRGLLDLLDGCSDYLADVLVVVVEEMAPRT